MTYVLRIDGIEMMMGESVETYSALTCDLMLGVRR